MSVFTQPLPHYHHGSTSQVYDQFSHGTYRSAPPPQHGYHFDPVAFRHAYNARLAELTVNSRPLIEDLTRLAQEQWRFSNIVARCIEAHIRRAPSTMKLPAFYLLDNVSKSVNVPYAAEFTLFVVPLFLETYSLVDNITRSKMEAMLRTWRTGSPAGKELFGIDPQIAIERGIWGERGDPVSEVMGELEFAIRHQQRGFQARPHDNATHHNLNILHELRSVVVGGLSDRVQLKAILDQIRTLMRNTATTSAPLPPPSANHGTNYRTHPQQIMPPAAPVPRAKVEEATPPPIAMTSPDILSLLTNLMNSGVVSSSGTPVGAGTSSLQEIPDEQADSDRTEDRSYRESILGHQVSLTTSDIMKPSSHHIIDNLYESQPAQCKQCGQRFSDTPSGKQKMAKHLDMHFVQNRQASQQSGRGHYRGWFISPHDWVNTDTDVKGKSVDRGSSRGRGTVAADKMKNDEELRAMFVVVPPGDEAKPIRCPICKEALKSEFLEDEEEWVWKNATKKGDTVFHATCHSEAAVSASTLVSRLRADSDSRSRSRSLTPEVQGRLASPRLSLRKNIKAESSETQSPSSLAGSKRKAEDEDPEGAPCKRVAI